MFTFRLFYLTHEKNKMISCFILIIPSKFLTTPEKLKEFLVSLPFIWYPCKKNITY